VSAAELVSLTIDDVEVRVPKGLGLVETAIAAGIEIPVFCYEPRLGPPVGACRMCLVEVEGMPKLQAGCTMTAQDGMVVKTAATSDKAAEGQNATLEFILVNHPLDCPVCDKGGECPLQDLTFRYGPGSTRMTFPKRTFDKPIPISPTIALDRERCILCYRCTRFSEEVAEDGQLVARNRGAQSLITTFEERPYRAPFSGNVIELCPVGALTSTQYRFQARPWEIQNVPTVCGMCPVGCNIHATTREGKVKRILSRNHPELDAGWLCDKGRFAYSHLQAGDRIGEPMLRVRRRGFEPVSWERALDEAEQLLRGAEGRIVTALSGSETIEQAYALARILRTGLGAHTAVLPEDTSDAIDAFRLPLAAIADAELIVVVGDDTVVERAPIVELWIRVARRNGAEVVTIGPVGDVLSPPGAAAWTCRDLAAARNPLGKRLRASERAILIWSGPGGDGGARIAALADALGFREKERSGAFHLPLTSNGLGVAEAWAAASDEEPVNPEPIGLLIVSGDEAAANPNVRALAERAERVLAITMFQSLAAGWADLVLPGTSYLERDGTYINLEGRLQRLRRAVIPDGPDELEWLSQLATRFGLELSPYAPRVFDELAASAFGGLRFGEIAEVAPLRVHTEPEPPSPLEGVAPPAPPPDGDSLQVLRYRPLFSGVAVERVPELQFQRPEPEIELAYDDAQRRDVSTGDEVQVRSNGTSLTLRARVNRRLLTGIVRIAEEHAADLAATVEVTKSPLSQISPEGGDLA
jgi:NADH-quinone oxidoreductase subunit G